MSLVLGEQLFNLTTLENSQGKVNLIERLIKAAQASKNLEIEAGARILMIQSATDVGQPEKVVN